jgi:site-specific DNA-methyltransferase (adenine-specific)
MSISATANALRRAREIGKSWILSPKRVPFGNSISLGTKQVATCTKAVNNCSSPRKSNNVISLGSINKIDVLEGLKQLPSESCDILLSDPPYNIGKNFKVTKDRMKMEDYLIWCDRWLTEGIRVLKPYGTMFVFGYSEILAHLSVRIPIKHRWLIWHYTNKNTHGGNFWHRSHESIICAWKATPIFNIDSVREPYSENFLKGTAGKVRPATEGRFTKGKRITVYKAHERGALPRDVIKIPALAGGAGALERYFLCHDCGDVYRPKDLRNHRDHNIEKHPTQKPLKLIDRLIKSAKPLKKGLVISLFSGSGTDCVAAMANDMDYIAFDLNEDYIRIANKRIADFKASSKY